MDGTMNEDWIENARMIVESARAVVPADGNLARVRAARFQGCGFDRAVMAQAAELGWPLMRVAEDAGGLGLGPHSPATWPGSDHRKTAQNDQPSLADCKASGRRWHPNRRDE